MNWLMSWWRKGKYPVCRSTSSFPVKWSWKRCCSIPVSRWKKWNVRWRCWWENCLFLLSVSRLMNCMATNIRLRRVFQWVCYCTVRMWRRQNWNCLPQNRMWRRPGKHFSLFVFGRSRWFQRFRSGQVVCFSGFVGLQPGSRHHSPYLQASWNTCFVEWVESQSAHCLVGIPSYRIEILSGDCQSTQRFCTNGET